MSNFPDLSSHGYQVVRELGHNRAGGRVTYLALNLKTRQPAVIKRFQFAKINATWSDYDAYQREIQVLQGLNHPGIPRYLDSFQTSDGFCMVQEYKKAPSLAVPRSFDPDEIKKIAVSLLEILVYLQNRIPTVIHRDIKPENILVDGNINVFLVDFGLARIGDGEVTMNSVAKGTLGFMPPEQLFHRQLTEASDLYSLGATLICLLTGIKSAEISQLIDDDYRINFKHLVPKLSLRWIDWLQKMVEIKPKDRYPNAAIALEALKPIYVIRVPEAKLSKPILEFKARKLGERVTQTIAVTNSIPDTLLEGNWEVAPHESDPPHTPDTHTWISFDSVKFENNQAKCKINVNTSRLMADKTYERHLLLHTNSLPETHDITVKIQTAPVPIANKKLPYIALALLVTLAASAAWIEGIAWGGTIAQVGAMGVVMAGFITLFVAAFGVAAAATAAAGAVFVAKLLSRYKVKFAGIDTVVALLVAGIVAFFVTGFGEQFRAANSAAVGFEAVDFAVFMAGFGAQSLAVSCLKRGFSPNLAIGVSLLAMALGMTLGVGFQVGLLNPLVMGAVLAVGLPLGTILFYPPFERARLIGNYRKFEQHLIKP
ncbi:serine/threonine-protein kinase [Coleofasciculus sp. FACHB-129]|uniref:serine/threonine protein kinase n=1 Tax=Cyanophyceae TaxID=3028117 RepID=UPI0016827863|nr:serine/threonine-protein kinase [Coleofasciculus sp. FACHB-129]MBD1897443.1 serine/threonine protein kinase [Coleofasciculus sp. FACHB-129]